MVSKQIKIEFTQQSKLTTAKVQIVYEGSTDGTSENFINNEDVLKEVKELQDKAQLEAARISMKYN